MQKISLNVPREGILIAPPVDFAPESQKTSEWLFCKQTWGSILRNFPTPVLSEGSTNTFILLINNKSND